MNIQIAIAEEKKEGLTWPVMIAVAKDADNDEILDCEKIITPNCYTMSEGMKRCNSLIQNFLSEIKGL